MTRTSSAEVVGSFSRVSKDRPHDIVFCESSNYFSQNFLGKSFKSLFKSVILDDSEPASVSRVYRTFVNVPARSQTVLQSASR